MSNKAWTVAVIILALICFGTCAQTRPPRYELVSGTGPYCYRIDTETGKSWYAYLTETPSKWVEIQDRGQP